MTFTDLIGGRSGAGVPSHNRLRGLEDGNPHPQYSLDGHAHASYSWTDVPTFLNSWTNFGGEYVPARYCKSNGIVHLQGMVKSGTIGLPMFVLPAGYRPNYRLYLPCLNQSAAARLDVDADGNVYIMNGAATPTDAGFGVSFPADA